MKRRIALIRFHDAIQEFGTNDTPATPDGGDVAEVQVPIVLVASGPQQFHSLCIRNDFRGVKRIAHRVDQLVCGRRVIFLVSVAVRIFEEATRSSFREEITRASTAALIVEITTDC